MLNLLKKINKQKNEPRVLMLGLNNAGKSTILYRYLDLDVKEVVPTLGFVVKRVECQGYGISIWDLGGKSKIRCYWDSYYNFTDLVILVVDSDDRERLGKYKKIFFQLLKEKELAEASLLVFCNKQDIQGCLTVDEIKEYFEINYFRERNIEFISCSALMNQGISEGMDWVINDLLFKKKC